MKRASASATIIEDQATNMWRIEWLGAAGVVTSDRRYPSKAKATHMASDLGASEIYQGFDVVVP